MFKIIDLHFATHKNDDMIKHLHLKTNQKRKRLQYIFLDFVIVMLTVCVHSVIKG